MNNNQLPPQNVEAEEAVLGGILLDPEAIARVEDILIPNCFYVKQYQIIYDFCLKLYRKGIPTDLLTVKTKLEDNGQLKKIGGIDKLVNLTDSVVSSVNIDRYAELVVSDYKRRQLIQVGHEITEAGYNKFEDLEDIFDRSEKSLFAVTQNTKSDITFIDDLLVRVFQDLEERIESGKLPGIATNFYDLDMITGGLQKSDLVILAGRPSMGKTAFSLQISFEVAKQGLPVAIFSLEMSAQQITTRFLCSESKVESLRLRTGQLRAGDQEKIYEAMNTLSQLPIAISEDMVSDVNSIANKCRQLKAKKGELGLIVVDYLQLIGKNEQNRVQELSKITRGLKALARELDCPVLCLSQLSRNCESRNDKRPMLSDLRDSGAIEQDADLVLMLYRDEYYNTDSEDRGLAELIIAKHRNGATGSMKLQFNPEVSTFYNLAS